MDLQEKRQLDLVKQAASVRARARPWRAIIFTVLAIAAACASYAFGRHLKTLFEPLLSRPRLHVREWASLCLAKINVHLAEGDLPHRVTAHGARLTGPAVDPETRLLLALQPGRHRV